MGTHYECVSRMDDKLPNEMDENDEIFDTAEESGPLGRLLEHSIGSPTAESEIGSQSGDYAQGTHEHDDDREE